MLSFEDDHRFTDRDESDETITSFEATLYPTLFKNPKSTKNFIQIGSLDRKRGYFCNDDLYLLPYSKVTYSEKY